MSDLPVSVGQATHTLADTAARHHIVGRLCTAMYQSMVDPNLVITNKGDFKVPPPVRCVVWDTADMCSTGSEGGAGSGCG